MIGEWVCACGKPLHDDSYVCLQSDHGRGFSDPLLRVLQDAVCTKGGLAAFLVRHPRPHGIRLEPV